MQYDIILINDNLLKTYIDLLLTDKMELILMFYYMASCFRDRKQVRNTRFERHLTGVKKESFYRSRKQ